MTPIQERAGCLWQSADPADIWLNESGPQSPKVVTCQTPQGGTALVRVEDLNFIGTGLFGAGRPCLGGSAKWTGDSYRYGIYTTHKPYTGPAIVILQSSGGGMVGLQFDFRTSVETWQHLATTSSRRSSGTSAMSSLSCIGKPSKDRSELCSRLSLRAG